MTTFNGLAEPWMLEGAGVPPRLRAATFATADATASIQRARAFFDARGVERGRAFVLLGPTGVGKSWAGAAIVNADIVANAAADRLFFPDSEPWWTSCAQLVDDLRDFSTRRDAMCRARRARLLVLDDVQRPSDADFPLFERVLSVREQDERAVLITSNLPKKEFYSAVGARVVDRLRAWGETHEIRGPSLRGEKS